VRQSKTKNVPDVPTVMAKTKWQSPEWQHWFNLDRM